MLAACGRHPPAAMVQSCGLRPIDAELTRTVARSAKIVVATAQISPKALADARRSGDYADVNLVPVKWLKGGAGDKSIKTYAQIDQDWGPSYTDVLRAAKTPQIFYARWVGNGNLYLDRRVDVADYVSAVQTELARQAGILTNWRDDASAPHYSEVKTLVDQMAALKRADATPEIQEKIYRQLIALPPDATQAIVARLDDRRPLVSTDIMVKPLDPDWFELPHVEVEQVADVLAQVMVERSHQGIAGDLDTASRNSLEKAWKVFGTDQRCGVPWPRPEIDIILERRKAKASTGSK